MTNEVILSLITKQIALILSMLMTCWSMERIKARGSLHTEFWMTFNYKLTTQLIEFTPSHSNRILFVCVFFRRLLTDQTDFMNKISRQSIFL